MSDKRAIFLETKFFIIITDHVTHPKGLGLPPREASISIVIARFFSWKISTARWKIIYRFKKSLLQNIRRYLA